MPLGNIERLEIGLLLLAAVMGLTMLARRLLIPYPILLVLGGLALALVPGLPTIPLPPDLVFLIFLPPILWAAAYFTSLRDFRLNLRPILLLAIGLVLATTLIVAVVARAMLPGLAWAAAITLGALVSPPDAVAATAMARRLGMPRRVTTILEGESLVNDATALVLYRAAVAAAAGGTFVLQDALLTFVLSAVGGCAIGLAVAWVAERAIRLSDEMMTDIAITLLSPYAAWVLAEQVHASAVLACVAGGMLMRQRFSTTTSPETRLQGRAVWELVVFVLNGLIFMMIGLQLRGLGTGLAPDHLRQVILTGVAVSVTVIVVRMVWVPVATVIPRWVVPGLRERDPMPPKSAVFLISWIGMRGILSLAAALALPTPGPDSAPFPFRSEILLIAFIVILFTLVVQGLSLPPLVRWLGIEDDGAEAEEEATARRGAAEAGLRALDEARGAEWARPDHLETLREHYQAQVRTVSELSWERDGSFAEAAQFRRLRRATLEAERAAVIALRNEGAISDEILLRVEQELDVEMLRLGNSGARLPA